MPLLLLVLAGAQATTAATFSQHKFRRADDHAGHSHGGDDDEDVDCSATGIDNWEKGLHIAAIFIVMAVSGLGSFLPVVGHYLPVLRIPKTALTLGKYLGTGVIISTALIHMLPSAIGSLNSKCVGNRMGDYSSWPGVLAMMAIFAMHLMDRTESVSASDHHSHARKVSISTSLPELSRDGDDENCDAVAVHTHHTHVHGLSFIPTAGESAALTAQRHRISTYILELGICLHSVIIGLTLSVTTGTSFKTLLVAICFHQFCEGLALGSRIAQMEYKSHGFLRAALNAAAFMLITPLGMVIGVGVRYSYQPNSPSALITMGVLDSLSAGILLYAGLVNLLAEEFSTIEFRNFRPAMKAACFITCFIGAGIMALIGKWA
ncbi:Zinc/iron permease [Kickxella alabastrina]|uniref:Zinc/iron permease n=1 Tax=Kickxella alabastrina TaxID=61397 RepID=UPI00221E4441|nr:Zinc/iron permease [Kickxella alabastrina]KAI7820728.1 Zinc/iron permease [Kickxella alabastrina]